MSCSVVLQPIGRTPAPLNTTTRESVLGVTCAPGVVTSRPMEQLISVVEEAPEGSFTARALGASIFTEADTVPRLHGQVRDAVSLARVTDRLRTLT